MQGRGWTLQPVGSGSKDVYLSIPYKVCLSVLMFFRRGSEQMRKVANVEKKDPIREVLPKRKRRIERSPEWKWVAEQSQDWIWGV